jgi:hypothetical protein
MHFCHLVFCIVPFLQDDVASLRASAAAALRTLEDAGSGQAAAVVGQLTELDLVKRRMEDACSTLKVRGGGGGRAAHYCCTSSAAQLGSLRVSMSGHLLPTPPHLRSACSPPSALLQEAAGLSALFQQVEEHFASGNLRRVADALAGMRRGLAVVGDSVAEFRGGWVPPVRCPWSDIAGLYCIVLLCALCWASLCR